MAAMQTSSEQAPPRRWCGFEGREHTEPCGLGEALALCHTSVSSSQKQDHSFTHSMHAHVSTYHVPHWTQNPKMSKRLKSSRGHSTPFHSILQRGDV